MTEPQRHRLEEALGTLQRAHAGFEGKLRAFSQATAERGVLESTLAAVRRSARVSPATGSKVAVAAAELGQANEKCQTAQGELESARQLALSAIRDAGHLIQTVCAPLLDQFKSELAEALRAFCLHPEGTAAAIPDHGTEFPALVRFLQRGQHVSRLAGPEGTVAAIPDHATEFPVLVRFLQRGQHVARTAGPEEIEWLTFELGETLRRILDGGDIWKLRGEIALAGAAGRPG